MALPKMKGSYLRGALTAQIGWAGAQKGATARSIEVPQRAFIPGCGLGICVDAAEPLSTLTTERMRFARNQDTPVFSS